MKHEKFREDGFPVFYASSAEAWRDYLARHHDQESRVWLIIYKRESGVASLSIEEAINEALCFGWVDSKPNKRDADSYYQFFARRNPKSNWSRVNKDKIERLAAAGKLAPAGLEMVRVAKETGTWDALNEVEDLIVPADMEAVFQQFPDEARANWEAFPRTVKRGVLEWIFNAKRPATRAGRIEETVTKAAKNERANQWQ